MRQLRNLRHFRKARLELVVGHLALQVFSHGIKISSILLAHKDRPNTSGFDPELDSAHGQTSKVSRTSRVRESLLTLLAWQRPLLGSGMNDSNRMLKCRLHL